MKKFEENNPIASIEDIELPQSSGFFKNPEFVNLLLDKMKVFLEDPIETEKLVKKNFKVFIAVVEKLSKAVGIADNRNSVFSGFWEKLPIDMQRSDLVTNCLEAWEDCPSSRPTLIERGHPERVRRRMHYNL